MNKLEYKKFGSLTEIEIIEYRKHRSGDVELLETKCAQISKMSSKFEVIPMEA